MKAFIGLGSNLGDRRKNIERAIEELRRSKLVKIIKISNLYETEPIGGPVQDKFLNGVAEIETKTTPRALLALLKIIENEVGRSPSDIKWGPREIDLDILLCDDLVIDESDLKVPHPLLHLRDFVLEPFCEIAPHVMHPILKKNVAELFSKLKSNTEQ
ncbi:MAG: 2-amino-4-hydroxy-6-hydroxymethyldihydropteridine diphosphokinase [Candidatus Omnitrophota bacterium]